ncbi:DUF5709 domain-containing protein [Streptomyces sp. NPDC058662]|uniref:DUF5709 domain-containing protein n=1 Tax=Streptomyces sp. NPDC058662 TaxID=3346583 RepID=UPI003655F2FE
MSDDTPLANDVYQPDGSEGEQGDGSSLAAHPDLQNALDERTYDDTLDEGYSPPEKPLGVTKYGLTAAEQAQGEGLDARLSQEVPEVAEPEGDGIGDVPDGEGEPVDVEAGLVRAGRLVAPDEGAHPDTVKELTAQDRGIDGGAASAEEAAMHVTEPEPEEPLPDGPAPE